MAVLTRDVEELGVLHQMLQDEIVTRLDVVDQVDVEGLGVLGFDRLKDVPVVLLAMAVVHLHDEDPGVPAV